MSIDPISRPGGPVATRSRSMGLKLIVVCALAVCMVIPGMFVGGLVDERSQRAAGVIREISDYAGGQQVFLGPTLLVPYRIPPASSKDSPSYGTYLVFPATASAAVRTVTEERHRSLFKVPVYRAEVEFNATFDLTGVPAAAPERAELNWDRAELVVGVSNPRGALSDAILTANGETTTLAPARAASDLRVGDPNQPLRVTLLSGPVQLSVRPGAEFTVASSLRFSGAQRIAILSYGKTTHLTAQGDWPSPGFDGGFLPFRRNLYDHGFTADWTIPFIARGVRAEGTLDSIDGLASTALGTSFVEVADPYQSVNRSRKYTLLFVGLVFLSYFIFEVTTGRRVHPAQYCLVGVAQIIFYLLLLSLAERVGFDWAFAIAGSATVALLSVNASWVFASRMLGLRALAVFTFLYASIYMLLRLEDNALLVGAVASFLAIAATMYFTRRIDWYGNANPGAPATN